jgi:hypothetical protein
MIAVMVTISFESQDSPDLFSGTLSGIERSRHRIANWA